ncbi:hypothetical protein BkAM31D_06115 [Halalkalibacter krulwichiae]|uniref:Uncharacterized protein n=1 Tax=Halalkalibacter krulwichiae TaxID=199441 RepID=A0A1X9MBC8_9BACI|nr:hypothetical protein [Halalkalibacter krulwichiae]ARK29463.1 hypothetical protein BkAM31D_06115 [Halalkalibacter krulwichiae]
MKNRYHCCATCRHFAVLKKEGGGILYKCVRLGFETKTTYTFHCWDPKEHIRARMKKEGYSSS